MSIRKLALWAAAVATQTSLLCAGAVAVAATSPQGKTVTGQLTSTTRSHPFQGVLATETNNQMTNQTADKSGNRAPMTMTVTVIARDHQFVPMVITTRTGAHLSIELKNEGRDDHNLTFRTLPLKTDTLSPGQTAKLDMTAPAPGRYPFYCSVGNHAERGMTGLLVVTR